MSDNIIRNTVRVNNVLVGDEVAKTIKFVAVSGKGFKRVVARLRNKAPIFVMQKDGAFVASNDKKGNDIIVSEKTPQKAFEKAVAQVWVN